MNTHSDTIKFTSESMAEDLQVFLDSATIAIHLEDRNGVIIYANKAELQLLGYDKKEYLGHNIAEFHADSGVAKNILAKLQRHESLSNMQARLTCKDGSVKDVSINANAHFEDNTFTHTRCFTVDITPLKKAERSLQYLNKAGEELSATHDTREALDKIAALIVPHFSDWFIVNELRDDDYAHLIKMVHADPKKVVAAERYRKTHPIDLNDPQVGSVGWVMRTGESVLLPEVTDEIIERGAKDAEQLEIIRALSLQSLIVTPMQIKGKVTGVISFVSCNPQNRYDEYDLNFAKDFAHRMALTLENTRLYEEIKRDADEKTESVRKKDEFISIASHELRTPVTSLKAYTQILQMNFEEQENSKDAILVAKMDKQIDKLTELISDLLDVTRMDKGEMVFDIEKFDFNDLVREIAEEMQRTTNTHKIKVELNTCNPVTGDRNRIAQVITNLISNAIKYSPEAGEIEVISGPGENNVAKLCVRDFGVGIPKQQQPEIFKRFFRASGRNYTFPGLGLGLYISSEIIKRHSGKIYFESEENKGSTFCFEIPL